MKKSDIKIFTNRGEFAQAMLDKYGEKVRTKVVSDIGAGFGFMEDPITERGFEWQPFDYYKKIDRSEIWDLNNSAPEGSRSPGIVLMLEVLEHLPNPLLAIKNIAHHLEEGGYFIFSTPNPASSKNRLNLLMKGELYAFGKAHLEEYHVFTPWKHIVEDFLKSAGMELLEYTAVDDNYRRLKPRNIKEFIKFRIEKFIERKDPYAIGMSYGMVAVKKTK